MATRDIDAIIAALTAKHPRAWVEQLKVKHPGADDDGLWFFSHPESAFEVQLESPFGAFPFLVESNRWDARGHASTVDEAVEFIESWLGLPAVKQSGAADGRDWTRVDLLLIKNALNEVCNGVDIEDFEFQTRLGASREDARELLRRIHDRLENR